VVSASRIGAKLSLFPEKDYLHAGTPARRSLGLPNVPTLSVSEFPNEFRALKSHEIEDALCIFKDEFASFRRIPVPVDPPPGEAGAEALSGP
jgi:hypothetical protein